MADNKKSSISRRSSCYLLNLKQPDKTARRLKLSFQRTAATVTILKADRRVDAAVGFLDVSDTGAGIFTPELLHKGSHVELTITEPAPLQVRGIVAWSIPVTSGIHGGRFRCRSGIQFVLDGEEQVKAVHEFVRIAGMDPIENFRSAMASAHPVPGAPLAQPVPPAVSGEATQVAAAEAAPAAVAESTPPAATDGPVSAAALEAVPPVPAAAPAAEAPAADTPPATGDGEKQAA